METQTKHSAQGGKLNIGFFFLSLGVLISLITSVVSFLNLAFALLDKRFPDVLNASYQYGYNTYDYESIRMSLATLIIFFPVFLVISYFWNKFMKKHMSHADDMVKKWLIYILLFLSSLVVIIDLVVALFVGVYYIFVLTDRRKVFGFSVGLWSAIKSGALVLLLIYFSFYVMGSPQTQRLLRLDDRRITDLQSIQNAVINYWQQKEKLPLTLSELSNPLSGFTLPVDPEFEKGFVYEYKIKEGLTFELCATFVKPIPKGWRENTNYYAEPYLGAKDIAVSSYPAYPVSGTNESWDHEAGHTCFERTIDKDIYPPYPKPEQLR